MATISNCIYPPTHYFSYVIYERPYVTAPWINLSHLRNCIKWLLSSSLLHSRPRTSLQQPLSKSSIMCSTMHVAVGANGTVTPTYSYQCALTYETGLCRLQGVVSRYFWTINTLSSIEIIFLLLNRRFPRWSVFSFCASPSLVQKCLTNTRKISIITSLNLSRLLCI